MEGKKEHYINSPHDEKSVVAVIIVPDLIDADFAKKMRTISCKSQSTSCQQRSHTVQEKNSYAIEIVRKQCVGQGIGCLWGVLGENMKRDVQSGDMKTTLEKGEYSCFKKYESLRLLFSNSNPKEHQQLSAGGIQPDVALKWTMSFFHNVIESVYNSYAPWKKNFFVWDPNIPIQCHNESVIYLCLLTSAIHACASFFMDVGLHPKCPDELAQAIKNIKMKRDGENLSLVTFYTKAHLLSMNRSKETEKVFKSRYVKHWEAV